MDLPTIRVRAVGDGLLPFVDELGRRPRPGRYAGRDADGAPAAEDVPDVAYYRKAIRAGSLELLPAHDGGA